jgi:hypothetical protein
MMSLVDSRKVEMLQRLQVTACGRKGGKVGPTTYSICRNLGANLGIFLCRAFAGKPPSSDLSAFACAAASAKEKDELLTHSRNPFL